MCRLTEGVLKQFGFQKAEHHSMICHDWLGPRHVLIGTKVGKILIMEDAELKTSVDIINLIDNSHLISNSSMSESETADVKIKSAEKREISALISFKGGFICSLGSGRAVIVETQISKEEEEVKLQVTQMIKLPTRNATTAGNLINLRVIFEVLRGKQNVTAIPDYKINNEILRNESRFRNEL